MIDFVNLIYHTNFRYHCSVCDDFDLCVPCYQKQGHPHRMVKLGFDLDDGSSPVPGEAKHSNPQEARKLSIQRCIQSLVHACQCRDANCRLPSCQKMKRVVSHAKVNSLPSLSYLHKYSLKQQVLNISTFQIGL